MKIKRLDICGFKSFVDKTTLTFPDPITAVVGPNGCGKSNIVDAIRWVMGEQSAKHLRGRAMDDVIFAGSETRGPAGMAEVSLTFDSGSIAGGVAPGGVPWGNARPESVVVTRRLYRDGESEYLLGGVPCRLRDIVDFFLGTGVGSKAYAIIEQGRVGLIVSSRAEDRRSFIDEAAGITKYKAKKKLAERRMESTRQHLLRVSDIIGEIDTRLRSLRLQAQKAERYKKYKAELKDIELWVAAQKYLGLAAEEKVLVAGLADVGEQHQAEALNLEAEEVAVEAGRLGLTAEMAELSTAKDELFALSNKAQLALQRGQHYQSEAEGLEGRAAAAKDELDDVAAKAVEGAAALIAIEAELVDLQDESVRRRTEYSASEAVHDSVRGELAGARTSLDEARARSAMALASRARLESDIEGARVRQVDLRGRLDLVIAERAATQALHDQAGAELEMATGRLSGLESRRGDLARTRSELEAQVVELRNEVGRGELELETLREESHRRKSRLQSLSEIQAKYESFQRGVRAIMKEYRSGGQDTVGNVKPWTGATAVRGVVADIVQPPPELETAVEAVLGDRLGSIIVESHDVGLDAIEFLKHRSEGRSSFIPLSLRSRAGAGGDAQAGQEATTVYNASAPETSFAADPGAIEAAWPKGEGVRGPMLELIGYDRQYHSVAAYLMGDVVVVENLKRALELWRQTHTSKTIVTLDGEVIDPQGAVTGGSRETAVAGVLTQKREIRELEEIVARIDADQAAVLNKLVSAKQLLARSSASLEEVVTAARHDEVTLVAEQKDFDRAERDRRLAQDRRAQLEQEESDLSADLARTLAKIDSAHTALAAEIRVSADAETTAVNLRERAAALTDRLDNLLGALTEFKIAALQAEDRRAATQATMERLREEGGDRENRRRRLATTVDEDLARARGLLADAAALREEGRLAQAEADERAREHADRQSVVEERNAALSHRDAALRVARTSVADLARALSDLQIRCRELDLKRAALEEQVASKYRDTSLRAVVSDYHLRPAVGPTGETRIKELAGLIERMGEINLTAIEESADLQKRFDFLTAQKNDLESAISQLEAAIEKINRTSRKRFREVFDAIDSKFQEVFPRLFGGGRARLALTDESDMLETGVEIVANPPGKKIMQSIELLSGGEKALTAVALLFAIFLVKPSPFCLLDEVDAPLDEANVGRFNQMVREMTDRSQFILISHNRRTMEIADRLCGITMEEPGVSKLVAVNLLGSRAAS